MAEENARIRVEDKGRVGWTEGWKRSSRTVGNDEKHYESVTDGILCHRGNGEADRRETRI